MSVFLAVAALARTSNADWRQFLGTTGNSAAGDETGLPIRFSDSENIAWKVELPGRGPSSPIVVGNRVIVTCSSGPRGNRLHVICFDTSSGRRLWERQFWATGQTHCHPSSAVAAPTPASDGESIFAFYSSNDLVCLDLDGNLRWYRGLAHDYPLARNDVGMSSSPVIAGKAVIVQVENQGESFVAAIDKQTGETRWRIGRERHSNWSSPAVLQENDADKQIVLLQARSGLSARDPDDGSELWSYQAQCSGIPKPIVNDGVIYLASNGLTALRPTPGSQRPEVLWKSSQLRPSGASAVVHAGHVYTMNGTILNCGDAIRGKPLWKLRLAGNSYWATPVIAGRHLYALSYDGVVQVVRLGAGNEKGKIVSETKLPEQIMGTPAVAGGALYVRSDGHLWKVAKPSP